MLQAEDGALSASHLPPRHDAFDSFATLVKAEGTMNFLVTGARGFVGRRLLDVLAASGHCGIASGRQAPTHVPAGWLGAQRSDLLGGNGGGKDSDAIVHLEVKQHAPQPTSSDIEGFQTVNVGGTRQWLEWATQNGIKRFVFVSSIKAIAPSQAPQLEHAPLEPDTPYGRSKADAEQAVQAWAQADAARMAVILRPAPVYGPGNEANLAAFVRRIMLGKPCLVGRGTTKKSVCALNNLTAAIAFTACRAEPGCWVLNVSDRETLSLGELATLIAEVAGAPRPRHISAALAHCIAPLGDLITSLSTIDFPLTTARLKAITETSIFPCDKLISAGFHHPCTTREGLGEMLAWMRTL